MKKTNLRWIIIFLLSLALAACSQAPLKSPKSMEADPLTSAVKFAFKQQSMQVQYQEIVFLLYETKIDHMVFNEERTQALVWFGLLDPETGDLLATEPGLVVATLVNTPPEDPNSWVMTFAFEETWAEVIWQLPDTLMDNVTKQAYTAKEQTLARSAQVYTGYKLPWPQGMPVKLTGSIGHVYIYKSCVNDCLYAFDFANGQMFAVSAAKGGIVKRAVWEHPNGNTTHTNYILIEDPTTSPTTYALYFHLAQDSIPLALRTPGAVVYQGQFIGNADDTGASTGHHLHFHVHTNPHSYWGKSVDIVFDEVAINGGRPRTCKEAQLFPEHGSQCVSGDWFTSSNSSNLPPAAWLTQPNSGAIISTQTFTMAGRASDDRNIVRMQFFVRPAGQGWLTVAEAVNTSSWETEIDVCQLNLPDGPLDLAITVTDQAGKSTTTMDTPVPVSKQYTCPSRPPACQPGPQQIALFADINYGGQCALVGVGDYYGMDQIADMDNDAVSSLLVGSQVYAILYEGTNLKGTHQVFGQSDPDLSTGIVGANTTSSLQVLPRPLVPTAPLLPASFVVDEQAMIELSWTGDADQYALTIKEAQAVILSRDWDPATSFTVGKLPPGVYTLEVTGKNVSGQASAAMTFEVIPASPVIPQTSLQPLPVISPQTTVTLAWLVLEGASNVAGFDLQYRLPDQDWQPLVSEIPAELNAYTVILPVPATYEFRLRARALQGAHEAWKAIAETRTEVVVDCSGDLYPDNHTADTAIPLTVNQPQQHMFCPTRDVDWLYINLESPQDIIITFDPLHNQVPFEVTIFTPLGTPYVSEQVNPGEILDTSFTAAIPGAWKIRIMPYNPLVFGANTAYSVGYTSAAALLTPLQQVLFGLMAAIGVIGGVLLAVLKHVGVVVVGKGRREKAA